MNRAILGVILLASLGFVQARAVEDLSNSSFNEAAPTSANIPGWTSGWEQPAAQPTGYAYTTGWNYVGMVNGTGAQASGVYLGNGWVLTAAHVGPGTFTLDGASYSVLPNSVQYLTTTSGTTTTTADLALFQIYPWPALPALVVSAESPTAYPVDNVSRVVMIGFGDGDLKTNKTWGYNTVNINDASTTLFSYVSDDFFTVYGYGGNVYQVVSGDSGGGDFIYNSSTALWQLAGINEVTGTTGPNGTGEPVSGLVQLDAYAAQINAITTPVQDSPAMPPWALMTLGGALLAVARPVLSRR